MISPSVIALAKKVSNYEKDATGATTLWPTTQLYKAECPSGKRWYILGGYVGRTVNATCNVHVYDSDDNKIQLLAELSAAATAFGYPKDSSSYSWAIPYIMNEGDYVGAVFSVAQDANAYASCNVLEIMI